MTNIPSDEDFERAGRVMEERMRNIDQICNNVEQHFMSICPLHKFVILPQRDVNFRAYVFFETNKDIADCENNGTLDEIKDFVYAEIERAGRGKKKDTTVAFELDSHEQVMAAFNGNYFMRLH